jgi:hypothetical protein
MINLEWTCEKYGHMVCKIHKCCAVIKKVSENSDYYHSHTTAIISRYILVYEIDTSPFLLRAIAAIFLQHVSTYPGRAVYVNIQNSLYPSPLPNISLKRI